MLVRLDGQPLRLNFKSESFGLALASRLYFELNCAGNLVGVHDLKLLLSALWVLRGNKSTEPEDVLLDREEAGADHSLGVDGGVE